MIMNPGNFIVVMFACLLGWVTYACSSTISAGYENLGWGTGIAQVLKKYPRGQMARLGAEIIYIQHKPAKGIARRNFAFSDGKLHAITLTFDKVYVEAIGIERLLDAQKQKFGDGIMDRTQAPHMISYIWEGADTRITFAYAPKRADMTMIMYEQKSVP